MSDSKPTNPLEGLSNFSLGPDWARPKDQQNKGITKEGPKREYKQRRHEGDRKFGDRHSGGNQRQDRRQGGGGHDRRGNQFRRDDRNGNRGRQDFRREEIPAAEGVGLELFPKREAVQMICKEIQQVARVYSLFDVAQTILNDRSRISATFKRSEKKDPFYSCNNEEAIFLTKEEALQFLLKADWRAEYIEEGIIEVEPPKGNFQAVAKCGISGEWLGPPNYHGYQTEIRRLHRERFSHMTFETYSGKVRTERSEEAVAEWMEFTKQQKRWRLLSDKPAEEEPKIEAAEATPEEISPEVEAVETTPAEATSTPKIEAKSAEADDANWISDRAQVERMMMAEVIPKAFSIVHKVSISSDIPAKNLSPGLLVRLKGTSNHHRKHPAIIIPPLCKALEVEKMAVFKRKGKIFTGPARPNALAADAVLATRPAEMVTWIRENSPAKLKGLWNAVLPADATAPPAEYAADLFWLLQQGHILLYTDDTLVIQESVKPQQPKKKKAKPTEPKPEKASEAKPEEIKKTAPETTESPAEVTPEKTEKVEASQQSDPSSQNSPETASENTPLPPKEQEKPSN